MNAMPATKASARKRNGCICMTIPYVKECVICSLRPERTAKPAVEMQRNVAPPPW
jgi:hypothetical protein